RGDATATAHSTLRAKLDASRPRRCRVNHARVARATRAGAGNAGRATWLAACWKGAQEKSMRLQTIPRFFACSLLALAGCAEGALIEHPAVAWEAQPMQSVVDVASFSGDYDSNWGGCTFAQDGVRVFATCERGYEVTCRA